MTHAELQNLIDRSLFADLGYIGGDGRPAIRRVFCVWHRGPGRHLISTNTSSRHVKLLSEHPEACLYFSDSESQVNGAIDHLERRLALVGLTPENVVQMDCLFRDVWNIPVMEKVIKQRFGGKYPVRKSIQTEFAHVGGPDGLHFQLDAIAYAGD